MIRPGDWRMKDPTTGTRLYGRTRWRRVGLVLGPALGVVAVLGVLVANGVIAISLAISGIPFTLGAQNLSGNGFVQYATISPTTGGATNGGLLESKAPGSTDTVGGTTYDANTVTVLHDGTIQVLDQTICAPTPFGNNLLVEIKAGDTNHGTAAVSFSSLVADAPLLEATSATFTNIAIGNDAQDALNNYDPGAGITVPAGTFSQSADSVSINGLTQIADGTTAASFTLPGLTLSATFVSSCP
jgi:Family of unknown function (DUF6230)